MPFYTCSTTNATPVNGWGPGTCWWGADSNLGFFGLEGVTDGTSNTALFSEKLLGVNSSGPFPYAGDTNNREARRLRRRQHAARTTTRRPQRAQCTHGPSGLPGVSGDHASRPGSWIIGFSWTMGYQWHWFVNTYNHYNTPNKLTCMMPGDLNPRATWGDTDSCDAADQ